MGDSIKIFNTISIGVGGGDVLKNIKEIKNKEYSLRNFVDTQSQPVSGNVHKKSSDRPQASTDVHKISVFSFGGSCPQKVLNSSSNVHRCPQGVFND